MSRKIVQGVYPAFRDDIGELVTRRPLPSPELPDLDPFLFLNHHGPQTYAPRNRGLPFGPHPHRGFETVTFILQGSLTHHDSGGASSVIEAGGVQWMTAGRGLVHAEVSPDEFMRRGGPLEILQLWVNLPARLKMTQPAYTGLQASQIPLVEEGGVRLQLIAGEWGGRQGPVASLTGVFMSVADFSAGGMLALSRLDDRTMFIYVVSGEVLVEGVEVAEAHLVRCSQAGDELVLQSKAGARILLGHAAPLGEPIVSHGPFVMNTVQEIETAIADNRAGKFGGLAL